MRIYFIGGHSTGKTTLARYWSERLKLPMISEVARAVLSEMELDFNRLRTDVNLVSAYQAKVFARQIEAEEAQSGGYISDRAFDNLAYAARHTLNYAGIIRSQPNFDQYVRRVASGYVFFIRPHRSLLAQDGVREDTGWDEVVRVDGMIELLLEQYEVPYLSVSAVSMKERVRNVEYVLRSDLTNER